MIVYVNDRNEIKDVNTTTDTSLIPIEMPEDNPFSNWSVAKICCFKLSIRDGKYSGFTPYVDTKIIEHIDRLAIKTEQNAIDIIDAQLGLMELYEMNII